MKKLLFSSILIGFILIASAFSAHKFYVSIYQIKYNQTKKSLEITARIFVDDLNKALEKKYGHATHLGDATETPGDVDLLKKYISENLSVKVNGKTRDIDFLSKEMENNVFVCYLKSRDIPKVTSLQISNKILFDFVTEQQNIIQTTVYGKKNSLLLTADNPSEIINF